MQFQSCLLEAIAICLDRDVPEEAFPDFVIAQASLMARIDPEEIDLH